MVGLRRGCQPAQRHVRLYCRQRDPIDAQMGLNRRRCDLIDARAAAVPVVRRATVCVAARLESGEPAASPIRRAGRCPHPAVPTFHRTGTGSLVALPPAGRI